MCHKRIFRSKRIEVPRQSPNSPDLSGSDRWMNEFMKNQLKATNVHEIGDLFVAVRKILSSVAKSIFKELQKYFRHCDHVIERNDDYMLLVEANKGFFVLENALFYSISRVMEQMG